MESKISIKNYFKGKNIFITGGSGFLGKALIEKLLRSCPDLNKIYILLRPKKGKPYEERVEQITSCPIFDLIKENNPESLKKIIPIQGDANQSGLGLSQEDRNLLINEIQIFYHSAASVKFDDPLRDAILINVKSSRESALLALEMKKLEVFSYISTAYCNIENGKVLDEILYPAHGNWRDAIHLAESCDLQTLNILSEKYLGTFPNTYVFTKLLAEHCINDLLVGKVHTVICRPTVVICSLQDPFRGWIDNFNGPVGLLLAGGSGLLRTVYGEPENETDFIPVDIVIRAIIVITWSKAMGDKNELKIHHLSNNKQIEIRQNFTVELGKQLYWDVPFERKVWFPGNSLTSCWYNYYINVMLFHMIPAVILDLLLRIFRYPPMFFKIQRKIYIGNMAVSHFMLNEWDFLNLETIKLYDLIPNEEIPDFGFKIYPTLQDIYDMYLKSCNYARIHLLKENKEITEANRNRTKWMYYLDRTIKLIFFVWLMWTLFVKHNIIGSLAGMLGNYWNNL